MVTTVSIASRELLKIERWQDAGFSRMIPGDGKKSACSANSPDYGEIVNRDCQRQGGLAHRLQ